MGLRGRGNDGKLVDSCMMFFLRRGRRVFLYIPVISLIFNFFGLTTPSSEAKSMRASDGIIRGQTKSQPKARSISC